MQNSGKFLGWVIIQTMAIALAGFLSQEPLEALPLSPGDRIRLLIPEGELFSGVYEVNLDGNIQIPYLDPLSVRGLEIDEAKQLIRDTLVNRKFFQPKFLQLNVSILQWAAVQVHVSGAVFQSGRISINNRSAEDRNLQQNQSSGDNPPERYLTAALRGAGGITPLANVKEVMVIRNNFVQIVDLSGVFSGEEVDDVPLIAGDRVVVPILAKQQNNLVRPSQITPPGIRVFLSNLTIPAPSNATSSIKSDGSSFPYGARFSQAVISANCLGGTFPTNSQRRAVLVRTDRQTGETEVFDRGIEQADQLFQQNLKDYNEASAMLVVLKAKWGDNHPLVVKEFSRQQSAKTAMIDRASSLLGRNIDQSNLQRLTIKNETGSSRESLFRDLIAVQSEQKGASAQNQALGNQIDELEVRLRMLVQKQSKLESLQREVQIAEAVFASTLAKLDLGKSDIFISYPITQLIAEPTLPDEKTSPKPSIVFVGAGVASIFITTGLVMLWWRKETSIYLKTKMKRSPDRILES